MDSLIKQLKNLNIINDDIDKIRIVIVDNNFTIIDPQITLDISTIPMIESRYKLIDMAKQKQLTVYNNKVLELLNSLNNSLAECLKNVPKYPSDIIKSHLESYINTKKTLRCNIIDYYNTKLIDIISTFDEFNKEIFDNRIINGTSVIDIIFNDVNCDLDKLLDVMKIIYYKYHNDSTIIDLNDLAIANVNSISNLVTVVGSDGYVNITLYIQHLCNLLITELTKLVDQDKIKYIFQSFIEKLTYKIIENFVELEDEDNTLTMLINAVEFEYSRYSNIKHVSMVYIILFYNALISIKNKYILYKINNSLLSYYNIVDDIIKLI
jgi:hypothetical protein